MKLKRIIISAALALLFFPVLVLAEATPPTIPLLVYGDVKIDGANAPIGAIVTVLNAASEVARTTIAQAGKYFLEVPAANVGASLTYKVNGIQAASAVCPNSLVTPSVRIDLSITMPPAPTPTPTPTPTPSPASGGNGGNPGGGGGGGGGGAVINCSSVTYNEWGACLNGFQERPVAVSAPTGCTLTTAQQVAGSRACVMPKVLGEKIASLETNNNAVGSSVKAADAQLNQILADSAAVWSENINTILANAGASRDQSAEKTTADKYLSNLTHSEKNFLAADANRLNFFITYGTVGTKVLGAGERAGVISSYKSAFAKLPKTEIEWQDAVKIALGRWPGEKNLTAEAKAKASFKKIYGREAKMDQPNDNAAVTVMAYGLRPSARNLNSEKAAILSFKYFIKRAPTTATDWDMVRAIAYSGAKR